MSQILFTMQDVEEGWTEFAGGGARAGLAQIGSGIGSLAGAGKDYTIATSRRGLKFVRKVGRRTARRGGMTAARGIGLAGSIASGAGRRLSGLAASAARRPGRTGAIAAAALGSGIAGTGAYLANRSRTRRSADGRFL